MRKRVSIVLILLAAAMMLMAQQNVGVGQKLPQVRGLENQGWSVQHSVLSFDSLTIYFSAKQPGSAHYELFAIRAEGWRWGKPEKLEAKNDSGDKLWPTISSDEREMYFVLRSEGQEASGRICKAVNHEGKGFTDEGPIIISGQNDARPQIAEDNRTFTFYRYVESKKKSGWMLHRSEKMDEHNWILPDTCSTAPQAHPISVITGTVVHSYGRRPLGNGRVYVYDAITQQLKQIARVHSVTGRFRIALQQGESYRLDITADGFSHFYEMVKVERQEAKTERDLGEIALSEKLHIVLKLYDSETQESLGEEKKDLSLGSVYPIALHRAGYNDTTLTLNTERQVLFAETEIDVALRPQKRRYHIDVVDARSGNPIDKAEVRMNGHLAPRDTALRLGRDVACSVNATGYLFFDTVVKVKSQAEQTEQIRIRLQPIEKDLVVQLRAIQFAYDSHELTRESNQQLQQLLSLMEQNPTLRIELSAHTDDRGTDKYNDRLSSLRGESVKQWLLSHGIDSQRIEARGYGKRKPLVANDSEENRALNRRVEIKIIDF